MIRHSAVTGVTKTGNRWEIGQRVNVGFLRGLEVLEAIPTPGDYAPDQYRLRAQTGVTYRFTPHKGIERE